MQGFGDKAQAATALCTVGKTGSGLTYRGFDIKELAEKAKFEEVAYLLLKGKLPNQAELDHYIAKLKGLRGQPDALKVVLEQIPKDAHPIGCYAHRRFHARQPGKRKRALMSSRTWQIAS